MIVESPQEHRDFVFFAQGTHWNRKFLEPGFSHCYAIRQKPGNVWILFDPRERFVDVRVYNTSRQLPMLIKEMNGNEFVEVPRMVPHNHQMWCPFNCVSAVKYFIGLEAPFVLTPFQLYKTLRKMS